MDIQQMQTWYLSLTEGQQGGVIIGAALVVWICVGLPLYVLTPRKLVARWLDEEIIGTMSAVWPIVVIMGVVLSPVGLAILARRAFVWGVSFAKGLSARCWKSAKDTWTYLSTPAKRWDADIPQPKSCNFNGTNLSGFIFDDPLPPRIALDVPKCRTCSKPINLGHYFCVTDNKKETCDWFCSMSCSRDFELAAKAQAIAEAQCIWPKTQHPKPNTVCGWCGESGLGCYQKDDGPNDVNYFCAKETGDTGMANVFPLSRPPIPYTGSAPDPLDRPATLRELNEVQKKLLHVERRLFSHIVGAGFADEEPQPPV